MVMILTGVIIFLDPHSQYRRVFIIFSILGYVIMLKMHMGPIIEKCIIMRDLFSVAV